MNFLEGDFYPMIQVLIQAHPTPMMIEGYNYEPLNYDLPKTCITEVLEVD